MLLVKKYYKVGWNHHLIEPKCLSIILKLRIFCVVLFGPVHSLRYEMVEFQSRELNDKVCGIHSRHFRGGRWTASDLTAGLFKVFRECI